MKFIVLLAILMVAISTVLLEVHWLTSPAPQPKPTVQAGAPRPAPKVEGPNAALSPVYPKKLDAPRPLESNSQAQTTEADTRQATGQTPPATNTPVQHPAPTTMALPAQQPEPAASVPQSATSQQPGSAKWLVSPQQPSPAPSTQPAAASQPGAQQSRAETTGAAVREENRTEAAFPANSSNRPDNSQQTAQGSPSNRCDIQACAGAYRSFRAADCTYQPFDGGARRFCEKSPGQRMAREREQPDRRRWSGDTEPRYLDRSTAGHRFVDEDDDAVDFDDFLFARRPRR